MKLDWILRTAAIIFLIIVASTLQSASANGKQIKWQVISSGATNGSSTSYQLGGTAGQTAVGSGNSESYRLSHGFWAASGHDPDGCCGEHTGGLTGNTNCSTDGKMTLSDITVLIDHVYISKADLCCAAAGNTNGSVDCKITLSDISRLIDVVYISKLPPEPCLPSCEQ